MLKSDSEAVLRYRSGEFEIVMPGTYVRCAVTGERIPLEDLRYWSFDRHEAYLSSEVATDRETQVQRTAQSVADATPPRETPP
jgi:hypothetical protein